MPVFGDALAADVGRRYGRPVQMMQLKHGIFDDASISVITSDTIREIGRLAERSIDADDFVRTSLSDPRARSPSRRMNAWAACSPSARETTPPPSPSPCVTFAARW